MAAMLVGAHFAVASRFSSPANPRALRTRPSPSYCSSNDSQDAASTSGSHGAPEILVAAPPSSSTIAHFAVASRFSSRAYPRDLRTRASSSNDSQDAASTSGSHGAPEILVAAPPSSSTIAHFAVASRFSSRAYPRDLRTRASSSNDSQDAASTSGSHGAPEILVAAPPSSSTIAHFAVASRFSSRAYSRALRTRASSSSSSNDSQDAASTSGSDGAPETPPAAPPSSSTSLVATPSSILTPEGFAASAQVNHYNILGVPYDSSTAQIVKAFKDRVKELKSRQKEVDDESSRQEELRTLQVSFEILTTEEEKRVYDWVLNCYENRSADTYIWPYETDSTQNYTRNEPPPVMRSFDEEGNNKVGLFFLGWSVEKTASGA